MPAIDAALDLVAGRHGRYTATVASAGARPDDGPAAKRRGVAWLTLGAGVRETTDLALDVDVTLDARTYTPARRPRPHLTVVRAVGGDLLAGLIDLSASLRIDWPVEEIVLFRSHTGRGGPRYQQLASRPLRRVPGGRP